MLRCRVTDVIFTREFRHDVIRNGWVFIALCREFKLAGRKRGRDREKRIVWDRPTPDGYIMQSAEPSERVFVFVFIQTGISKEPVNA